MPTGPYLPGSHSGCAGILRTGHNFVDDEYWKCFVNSKYDRETKKWDAKKCLGSISSGTEPREVRGRVRA